MAKVLPEMGPHEPDPPRYVPWDNTIRGEVKRRRERIIKHFGHDARLVLVGRRVKERLQEEAFPAARYAMTGVVKPSDINEVIAGQYLDVKTRYVKWTDDLIVLPFKLRRP